MRLQPINTHAWHAWHALLVTAYSEQSVSLLLGALVTCRLQVQNIKRQAAATPAVMVMLDCSHYLSKYRWADLGM